jgi:hypothetical protein
MSINTEKITISISPEIKRQIEEAASAHRISEESAAVEALKRGLPVLAEESSSERNRKKGSLTKEDLELFRRLRAEFPRPFTTSSADLIHEGHDI